MATKKELQDELTALGVSGWNKATTKPDLEALLAAVKADDAENGAPVEEAPPKPKAEPAVFEVQVNNGNLPGSAILSLDELPAIAEAALSDPAARVVTLQIKVRMVQGEFGAVRADGVK